ncbi:unnamed protein product [Darwinula stevensoni]|uniref:Uncharacterized protein n=1 Tax=Darwinula stevensoni TaxID=69355 RepID=A0A7R8XBQ3_9CRUS|nr:unnamed protein product [Darwinula stevensoni]CAG0891237.1 unnamed protein product [Darwinula stevensoni]
MQFGEGLDPSHRYREMHSEEKGAQVQDCGKGQPGEVVYERIRGYEYKSRTTANKLEIRDDPLEALTTCHSRAVGGGGGVGVGAGPPSSSGGGSGGSLYQPFDFIPGTYRSGQFDPSYCVLVDDVFADSMLPQKIRVNPQASFFNPLCLSSSRVTDCKRRLYVFDVTINRGFDTDSITPQKMRSRKECQDECLNRFNFVCRYAAYDTQNNDCYLSNYTVPTREMPNVVFMENVCLTDERECEYPRSAIVSENRALLAMDGQSQGELLHRINSISEEQCKLECDRSHRFPCKSAVYMRDRSPTSSSCVLTDATSRSMDGRRTTKEFFDANFFELACLRVRRGAEDRMNQPVFGKDGARYTVEDYFVRTDRERLDSPDRPVFGIRSRTECLEECLRRRDCASVSYNYQKRECILSRDERRRARLIPDENFDYFELLDVARRAPGGVSRQGPDPLYPRTDPRYPYDSSRRVRPDFRTGMGFDSDRYPGPRYDDRITPYRPGYEEDYRFRYDFRSGSSGADRFRPGDDRYRPGDDQYRPGDDRSRPGDDRSRLGDDRYRPGDDRYRPGDDRSRPVDDRSRPVDDRSRPGDDPYRPGDNRLDGLDSQRFPFSRPRTNDSKEDSPTDGGRRYDYRYDRDNNWIQGGDRRYLYDDRRKFYDRGRGDTRYGFKDSWSGSGGSWISGAPGGRESDRGREWWRSRTDWRSGNRDYWNRDPYPYDTRTRYGQGGGWYDGRNPPIGDPGIGISSSGGAYGVGSGWRTCDEVRRSGGRSGPGDPGRNFFDRVGVGFRLRQPYMTRYISVASAADCEAECARSGDCNSFNFRVGFSPGSDRDNCQLSDKRDLNVDDSFLFERDSHFNYYVRMAGGGPGGFGGNYGPQEDCIDITFTCDPKFMEFTMTTPEPFSGLMYTYNYYDRCYYEGKGDRINVLKISVDSGYQECGTRRYDDMWTNVVMVQFLKNLVTARDRKYNLTCKLSHDGESVVSSGFTQVSAIPVEYLPAQHVDLLDAELRIMYNGRSISNIAVGDLLLFRLEAQGTYRYNYYGNDIFATNVIARDPHSGRSILLIDERGCPVEPHIFPPLQRVAEGVLEGYFEAFSIPDAMFMVFEATVRPCRDGCPPAPCNMYGREIPSWGKRRKRRDATTDPSDDDEEGDKEETEDAENKDEEGHQDYFDEYDDKYYDELNATDLYNNGSFGEPAHVMGMFRVYLSREEIPNDIEAEPLNGCMMTVMNQGLLAAFICLILVTMVLTVIAGTIYRRYRILAGKHRDSDSTSPYGFSACSSDRLSTVSAFSSQCSFGIGRRGGSVALPPPPLPTTTHPDPDPSEPIYSDPSLFERSRSLRSMSAAESRLPYDS